MWDSPISTTTWNGQKSLTEEPPRSTQVKWTFILEGTKKNLNPDDHARVGATLGPQSVTRGWSPKDCSRIMSNKFFFFLGSHQLNGRPLSDHPHATTEPYSSWNTGGAHLKMKDCRYLYLNGHSSPRHTTPDVSGTEPYPITGIIAVMTPVSRYNPGCPLVRPSFLRPFVYVRLS